VAAACESAGASIISNAPKAKRQAAAASRYARAFAFGAAASVDVVGGERRRRICGYVRDRAGALARAARCARFPCAHSQSSRPGIKNRKHITVSPPVNNNNRQSSLRRSLRFLPPPPAMASRQRMPLATLSTGSGRRDVSAALSAAAAHSRRLVRLSARMRSRISFLLRAPCAKQHNIDLLFRNHRQTAVAPLMGAEIDGHVP